MHTYSQDLLLPYTHANWSTRLAGTPRPWEPSDSQELYQQNLLSQPADWPYRSQSVSYTWNTNGYRAPEWALVDWADSWIIMGCSHVVGIGLAQADTLGEQLSLLVNKPVINLGMGGSGADVIAYNTIRLIDKGIRPRGVVVLAPELTRLTYWGMNSYTNMNPHFQTNEHGLASSYAHWLGMEPNAELHGYTQLRGASALWASVGVPLVSAHHHVGLAPGLEIGLRLPGHVDRARDRSGKFGHYGPRTMKAWADLLARSIQSL
jgi:hypothetical protein